MIARAVAKIVFLCAATFTVGAKSFYEQSFPFVYAGETMTLSEAERLVGRDSVNSYGGMRMLEEYMLRLGEARRRGYGAIVDDIVTTESVRNDMMVALITADSVDLRITTEMVDGYFREHCDEFCWENPHVKCKLLLAIDKSILDSALTDSVYVGKNGLTVMEVVAAEGENAYVDSLVFDIRGGCYDSYYPSAAVVDVRILSNPEVAADVVDAVERALHRELYADWIDRLRRR